jgi:hypothetical protein
MPTWCTHPQAVAILSRIKPDNLAVMRFDPIVGPGYLVLRGDDDDTLDLLETLHAKRHVILTEELGMTLAEAREAGRLSEYIEFFRVAADVETVLAERFGDPAKFGSTSPDTATLLWRLEANEALVGRKAA